MIELRSSRSLARSLALSVDTRAIATSQPNPLFFCFWIDYYTDNYSPKLWIAFNLQAPTVALLLAHSLIDRYREVGLRLSNRWVTLPRVTATASTQRALFEETPKHSYVTQISNSKATQSSTTTAFPSNTPQHLLVDDCRLTP